MKVGKVTRAGLVAALYAALTVSPFLSSIGYSQWQVRIAEALTVLPFLYPETIWGLFFGCLVANLYSPYGLVDIFGGSLLTLVAAWLTSKAPSVYLAPLPPILINAFGVSVYISLISDIPYLPIVLSIGLGEIVACYGLGLPLLLGLRKRLGTHPSASSSQR